MNYCCGNWLVNWGCECLASMSGARQRLQWIMLKTDVTKKNKIESIPYKYC